MAFVELFIGSALSGRAAHLDRALLDGLPRARLIVPSQAYARERTLALVRRESLPGLLGQPILTFQDFVEELLRGTAYAQAPIGAGAQRMAIEGILADLHAEGGLNDIGPSAKTAGFVNHLHRVIGQLKQSATDPKQFLERLGDARREHSLDRVVAEAYTRYQERLKSAGAYDVQGMYWMADLACREAPPRLLAELDTLILDDFDDFTASEFRLLESLAPHLSRLMFGLAYDAGEVTEDQAQLARDTAKRIERAFGPDLQTHTLPEERGAESFTEAATVHLFTRRAWSPDPKLRENIRLVECYSPRHEAEFTAGEIKRLAREQGVTLDRVAVVHPEAGARAALWERVFADYGLGLRPRGGRRLAESGLGGFVLGLSGALERWERDAVLGVLASPYAGAAEDNAFAAIAAAAGIVEGAGQWRSALERFAAVLGRDFGEREAPLAHVPDVSSQCAQLLERVTLLEQIDAALPAALNGAELETWLRDALQNLGVDGAVREMDGCADEWAALNRALEAMARWGGQNAFARAEAAVRLRAAFQDSEIPYLRPEGVWFGRPEQARHLEFDTVFCPGMVEGVFPSPPPGNAIYGEDERKVLGELGIEMRGAVRHTHWQASLFQRLFEAAQRELIFSWPAVSLAGDPLTRSPLIDDVRVLFPQLEPRAMGTPAQAVLPDDAICGSARGLRNRLLNAKAAAPPGAVPGYGPALDGAAVEERRYASSPFDKYDGVISDPSLKARLAERFGGDHVFSATALQDYLRCPFHYFMERVLHVAQVEAPGELFDVRVRGTILHGALEAFHSTHQGAPLNTLASSEAAARLDTCIDDAFTKYAWQSAATPQGAIEAERAHMGARLRRYLAQQFAKDEAWAPDRLELKFERIELDTGSATVRLRGVIDRVDVKGDEFRLIDYKSGKMPQLKELKAGVEIQLALYALVAAGHLMKDKESCEAEYWWPGKMKDGVRSALKGQKWTPEDAYAVAKNAVAEAVEGMREGRFTLPEEQGLCRGCPKGKVCRYEEGRLERKRA